MHLAPFLKKQNSNFQAYSSVQIYTLHVAQDGECGYIADKLRIEVKEPLDEPTITLGDCWSGDGRCGRRQNHSVKIELLRMRTGRDIEIVAVSARSAGKDRGVDLSAYRWHDDPVSLAQSDDIDVFVELVGGDEGPAKDATEAALKSGKDVVTANKAMLAHHGQALAELAETD